MAGGVGEEAAKAATETELKVLQARKAQLFENLQKIYDAAKTPNQTNTEYLKRHVATLDSMFGEYCRVTERVNILEVTLKPSAKINFSDLTTVEEMHGYIVYKMQELTQPPPTNSNSQPSSGSQVVKSIKLQPLQLVGFSGAQGEWPVFYEIFKANVHSNPDLDDSHKLQYLLSQLSGGALSVCAGIPPTKENYSVMFNALVEKYQDTRNLAAYYVNSICNFRQMKLESADQLNLFVDKIGASVAALKSLGLQDPFEFILFHLTFMKLDDATKRLFENSLKKNEEPTFSKLLSFVQNQAKVLGRIDSKPENHNNSKNWSGNKIPKVSHSFVVKGCATCLLCAGEHSLAKCSRFLKLSPQDRYVVIKQNDCCVNCLTQGHKSILCPSKPSCRECNLRHNTMLHFNKNSGGTKPSHRVTQSFQSTGPSQTTSKNEAHSSGANNNSVTLSVYGPHSSEGPACAYLQTTVLLGTVKVRVCDFDGKTHEMRFLLDCASMSNIISLSACKQLGLNPTFVATDLKGVGSVSSPVRGQITLKFGSRFDERCNYTVKALVVDKIVDELPVKPVDMSDLKYLQEIQLSDDEFMDPGNVCGILGAQIYPYLVKGDQVHGKNCNQPVAINSTLGYVVLGNAPVLDSGHTGEQYCMFQCEKFWELDSVPECKTGKLSPEEIVCEKIYSDNVCRDIQGIYSVPLPFCEDPKLLGDSCFVAEKRFSYLEKKLNSNNDLKLKYNSAMAEIIDKGFMVKSSSLKQCDKSGYFIPHHVVVKPESPSSKIRVVYDASTKTTSGKSLNDILHAGPKMYNDLFCILINFRLFPYALNGDITQMFLQIKLLPDYWKFQRILWRFSDKEEIDVYELRVVIFGTKASPYLAQRTVKKLIEDEAVNFPLACQYVGESLYMDDCVISFLHENDGIEFYNQVVNLFSSGGFKFTKWSSNSSQILSQVPLSDRLMEMVSWNSNDFSHKILGMLWNTTSDCLFFKINGFSKPLTKRGILASILTMYDPMGLLAPVMLWAKLFIRELCLLKLGWDDTPPSHLVQSWETFQSQLPILETLTFPRHIGVHVDCKFQIIAFSDASEKGYGALIFGRVVSPSGIVTSQLICAKSKVSPLKTESIPRLELCAVLLLSNLLKVVINSYLARYPIESIYCFTDSTVALCWSHSSPHLFNTFVANRVSKIQQNMDVKDLYHVSGSENPADGLSRGLLPNQFVDYKIHFSGPAWLTEKIENWPIRSYSEFKNKEEVPEKKTSPVVLVSVDNSENVLFDFFSGCSSYSKLLNVMVYILRFTKKLSSRDLVTAQDLNVAELMVIRLIQRYHFKDIIDNINKGLVCSSSVRKLCPFLDSSGLLRVGGRLNNSNLSYDEKHPLLLPPKIHIVKLIVEQTHKDNCHTGPHLLLSLLRQKFWILGARNFVRKITQNCNVCFKNSPKCVYPQMGELPSSRVLESRPFFNTACDFLGPLPILMQRKRGARPVKVYVCLFICMAVKAVHLEVVSDLSTPSFLNAFKRFISRRGPIKSVLSDNGTNFVGARNQLKEIQDLLVSDNFRNAFGSELSKHRIEWIFNPPSSPHFGGIYEANVKSFKTHFYKVVGCQLLTYEELLTLTVQIESLLNSRPLCLLSNDPSDCSILTPNHFLNMTSLKFMPAVDVADVNPSRLTRFQLLDQMVQSYWKRWSSEYLTQMQAREKWNTPSRPVVIGLVVLIKQENIPPLHWPLGVITQVYPGNDGIIRVALVRTARGEFKRPVHKLCPLPTQ